ncbi:16S rRNA (guanine(527)-N(7))-methyltransferase RsmG [Thalassovita mangrovi]|uniref:Ribosomal RNA small subunit methyltransferase G n=1 Tax=Thalassovita mangrovi TaxID=2692236 RepID=A0A6L8LQA6_9RHOB|nr:16S rRNA (guanine(527)-N(7))-methyltransferase RsmG [Thalassovita mangrovi]MYM55359.1 16S rRNA (guanine(527)-N(7))-methyltransferase RsmG [Thalassovita mangrovi]
MVRLEAYAALLEKWNPKINLVARSTLETLWDRHFVDSAQVFRHLPDGAASWADLGSGGGFPGLVIAILAAEKAPEMQVALVESDTRKAAFLRTVIRETGISARVIDERIENIPPLQADVISARALADLSTLLGFAAQHLAQGGVALFPKGVNWEKEVQEARQKWRFACKQFTSETDTGAVILRIEGIEHV